jgi:hypothetical protein
MTNFPNSADARANARLLVQRLLDGNIPRGVDFDACRAVVRGEPDTEAAHTALCMLLEGGLADSTLDIDAVQTLVPLIKELARGTVTPEQLL